MNPLYNLGMRAFDAGISLGALKSEKIKKLRIGQKEAIDYLRGKIRPGQPYVWIHAASLGEFEQGRRLSEFPCKDTAYFLLSVRLRGA